MSKWTEEKIQNQTGRVAIVTGSSSGIGFEAARVLAGKGAKVIIAVRNSEKGEKAIGKIRDEFMDADLALLKLDLADLSSVKSFVEEFRKNYRRLDLLINNAGVMMPPYSKTADGFELQFGTNHLGHFALTAQLLDVLTATKGSRVVNVASNAHKAGKIDFDDLTWENRTYSSWRSYGDSKLANIYFTRELDKKLKANNLGTIAVAAHPGWTATELQRHSGLIEFLNNIFAQDVKMGALPTLRATFDEDAKGGDYFGPDGFMEMWGHPKKTEPNDLAKDEQIAEQLWKVSEELTGVRFEFPAIARKAAG